MAPRTNPLTMLSTVVGALLSNCLESRRRGFVGLACLAQSGLHSDAPTELHPKQEPPNLKVLDLFFKGFRLSGLVSEGSRVLKPIPSGLGQYQRACVKRGGLPRGLQ